VKKFPPSLSLAAYVAPTLIKLQFTSKRMPEDNLAGWWEAIIVRVDDGEFLVRWRDEPNEPRASRTQEYIALLHPALTDL
jgi:hypothetical protein